MKNHLIPILTLFICGINFQIHAQSQMDTTDTDTTFDITIINSVQFTSHYTAVGAQKDIKKNNIRILFPGGFGGMPDFNNEKDIAFQRKYSVEFFSQGCLHSGIDENEEAYNQMIFEYLDKKFGINWREEIRKGAIGFR